MNLGRIRYGEAYELQKELLNYVLDNEALIGVFLLVEHPPVFTIGKSGTYKDFLYSTEEIRERGIEIYESDRGGKITYHGLGQVVGYPILDLKAFKKDLHWYVHQIEETIIDSLKTFGISAGRKDKYIGVWVENEKICAIGIRLKKWVAMHGFALNHHTNLEDFHLINPCGIREFGVTSINKINQKVKYTEVIEEVKKSFEKIFDVELVETTLNEVRDCYGK
ncbi:Octanoyltransferase [Clostridium formicaceticum]|nr:Octanoyltransferase [Clostridium formicaceticum]